MAVRALLLLCALVARVNVARAADSCVADVPCPGGDICAIQYRWDPMEPLEPEMGDCQCVPSSTKISPSWTPQTGDAWLKCTKTKPTPPPCLAPAAMDSQGHCSCPACDSPQQPSFDRCKPGECESMGPYSDPPCHCYIVDRGLPGTAQGQTV